MSEKSEMSTRAALGYFVVGTGFSLLFVGMMLWNEYTQYPGSKFFNTVDPGDWFVPLIMIGLSLMGIGLVLVWPDLKQR